MKNIKSIAFLSLLLTCLSSAGAQSLNELLIQLKKENLELKALEKEYLAALEKAPQVSQMPDPEFGIGGFPLPVETRLGAQAIRVSGTQMLPWPGILEEKKNLAEAKARPLNERPHAKRLELEHELKLAYFKLYEITESEAIVRRNITLLESLERLALTKVESGKASAADVLTVQLKMEVLRQQLTILETAKTTPTVSINQLLQQDLATPIHITDSLGFTELPFDKSSLLADIGASHPMLRMFTLQQEASRQAISLNGLDQKPAFGVGLDYIMVGKRGDAEPANNGRDIVQLRASVRIPLYKDKYEAKEREENLRIEALEDQKTDMLSRFSAAIEKAYSEHKTARLRVELLEKQIELTRSAIRILEADYSANGQRFDELLRLEKELVDYDLEMLQAIVQSHVAQSDIERFISQ